MADPVRLKRPSANATARFVALTPSEAIARVRKAAHVHNEPGLEEAAILLELMIAGLMAEVGKAKGILPDSPTPDGLGPGTGG